MKIAGLIPTNVVMPNNPMLSLVDMTIIYGDNLDHEPSDLPRTETMTVINQEPWNDYGNRLTLLARAAAHGAEWVMWSDSDWTFPGLTKDMVQDHIAGAILHGCAGVSYRLREMWNATHYRSDGVWGMKKKVILQRNPLMERSVTWRETHLHKLHNVPLQEGKILEVDSEVLHWGMNTPEKRQARRDRYSALDPKNEFQRMGYDYLVNEFGMTLTSISTKTPRKCFSLDLTAI